MRIYHMFGRGNFGNEMVTEFIPLEKALFA